MLASASGGVAAGVVVLVILLIGVYMLPTIIGSVRKVVNIGSVFAINLLLGWTLIGWVVALAMACRTNPPYAYSRDAPASEPHSFDPPAQSFGPPAGWFPDPGGTPARRWWDGSQWTEHLQSAPVPSGESPD
jgi:hypothetical protein